MAEAAPDGRCQKDRDNQWTVRMRLLMLLLLRLLLRRMDIVGPGNRQKVSGPVAHLLRRVRVGPGNIAYAT